jgi:hypothetical protein
MLRIGRVAGFIIAALFTHDAKAYRPFNGTDADVADHGDFELEFGPAGYKSEGNERFLVAPAIVANYGIVDRYELVLEGKNEIPAAGTRTSPDEPRYRIVDTALNLKTVWREGVLQEAHGPSIATEFGILLPQVHDEPGVGASGLMITSWRWVGCTLHLNTEVALERSHDVSLFGGLIAEGPPAWPARPVAEAFIDHVIEGDTELSLLGGVIIPFRDNLAVDSAVRAARVGSERILEVRIGFTYAFGLHGLFSKREAARASGMFGGS